MNKRNVLIIRIIMGILFGIFLSKVFYPNAPIIFIIGLCAALIALAYLTNYLRDRSKAKSMDGPKKN